MADKTAVEWTDTAWNPVINGNMTGSIVSMIFPDSLSRLSKSCARAGTRCGRRRCAKALAAQMAPRRHRAEADARNLAVLWHTVALAILDP